MIEAQGLNKSFGTIDGRVEVLRGIDLRIERGERVGVVGTSGAGKTTLMHILGALDRPTSDRLAATLQEICRSQRLVVILVTHDLRLAGRVADYLVYLEGGQILEEGKAEDLLTRPATAELVRFLAEPEE